MLATMKTFKEQGTQQNKSTGKPSQEQNLRTKAEKRPKQLTSGQEVQNSTPGKQMKRKTCLQGKHEKKK